MAGNAIPDAIIDCSLVIKSATVVVEPLKLNFGVAQMRVGRTWNEFMHDDGGMDIQLAAGQEFGPATYNAPLAGTNFMFAPVWDADTIPSLLLGYSRPNQQRQAKS